MRAQSAINVDELAQLARRRLPQVVRDYLFGGAEDETAVVRNRHAFAEYEFLPRVLSGASTPSLETTLFGKKRSLPFIVGPTGLNGLFWHRGDTALARAAGKAGAIFTCSTAANETLEEVASANHGTSWFQLYALKDIQATSRLISRAHSAGYEALVITVDTPVPGKRERDLRNEFAHDIRLGPRRILDGLFHPSWLASTILRHGMPQMANLREFLPARADAHAAAQFMRNNRALSFSWDDACNIKDAWKGPVLLKGILSVDDVQLAERYGFDGAIISNHGGRQLDSSVPGLVAMVDILRHGKPNLPLLVDGGFRRGGDIVKALCLGASGVLLGRATLVGLAAAGEAGAARALHILSDEARRTMSLLGCASLAELDAGYLRSEPGNPTRSHCQSRPCPNVDRW